MFSLLKKAVSGFTRDDAIMMSAALAFYAALSLAPLLIIFITVTGYFLGDTQDRLLEQAALLIGPRTSAVVEIILESAGEHRFTGSLSAALSGVILVFSSTAVFAHLRKSMNRIWGVEAEPGRDIESLVRGRFLSFCMVVLVSTILVLSFFVSATLNLLIPGTHSLWLFVNNISSFFLFVMLFSIIFKLLPDIAIRWRNVFAGALATAFLFEIGKHGIGLYLGKSGLGSVYGAMGSLVMMLIWIYYSSVIFFFGVELMYAYTSTYGSGVTPVHHSRFIRNDGNRQD